MMCTMGKDDLEASEGRPTGSLVVLLLLLLSC